MRRASRGSRFACGGTRIAVRSATRRNAAFAKARSGMDIRCEKVRKRDETDDRTWRSRPEN